ncbi:von Willebrand factor A domain-containing protein 2 isoform X2 [Exaiptasia diaphana]|uniref:VWFA domain-containing protein n=1 Tax=Exaiptasia diaphana TaxID=2652724 RepID=A0A913XYF4_EXADI|nr:von Willebrand factor A domain-containing protein 2 isoform X2 [Exaiptasia diaphana]KXJ23742.1 Matrilin-2 [Exaiptasia diaphana]
MLFSIVQIFVLSALSHASQDAPACTDKQDLAFLIDTTTTITEQGVVMAQSLAISIISNFTINKDYTRAAYVSFGHESMIRFSFKTFSSNEEVDLMIALDDSLNGTASLNETMHVLNLLFSEELGSRPDVNRVLIFISNGKFTDELQSEIVQEYLKEQNIKLLVAGVGREIDVGLLELLVDDKVNDIFTAEERNSGYMIDRIHELTKEFCNRNSTQINENSSSIS